MKACKKCRLIVLEEKTCPTCGPEGELTDKFSGMLLITNPEKSEVAKVTEIKTVGTYAIRVK